MNERGHGNASRASLRRQVWRVSAQPKRTGDKQAVTGPKPHGRKSHPLTLCPECEQCDTIVPRKNAVPQSSGKGSDDRLREAQWVRGVSQSCRGIKIPQLTQEGSERKNTRVLRGNRSTLNRIPEQEARTIEYFSAMLGQRVGEVHYDPCNARRVVDMLKMLEKLGDIDPNTTGSRARFSHCNAYR